MKTRKPFVGVLVSGALLLQSIASPSVQTENGKDPGDPQQPLRYVGRELFVESRTHIGLWRVGSPENNRNTHPTNQRISVEVAGEAFAAGKYALRDDIQLFDAVVTVGGPSEEGSLRSVRLRRSSGEVSEVDLYPIFLRGDMRGDVKLRNGDKIEFTKARGHASLELGFKRPGIYEIARGDRLSNLMAFANGPAKIGEPQVVRITNRFGARQFLEFPIDQVGNDEKSDPEMFSGDVVEILRAPLGTAKVEVFGYDYFLDARREVERRRNSPTLPTEQLPKPVDIVPPKVDPAKGEIPVVPMLPVDTNPIANMDRYQLGPGDTLNIYVGSRTVAPERFVVTVDGSGSISAPISGRRMVVRGQTPAQLEKSLVNEISGYLRSPTVTIELGKLRTIAISVIGEAYAPGLYQLPAVATLFHALLHAGGPSIRGSLRSIQLKRANGSTRQFDVYGYLLGGDANQDATLQPGDVIFVPPAGPRATVTGEFGRPGIYELRAKETLRDAMRWAGGLKPTAVSSRISIEGSNPGVARTLIDVDADSRSPVSNPEIREGDIILAQPVRPEPVNEVRVEGAVDQPGRYSLTSEMRVSDLIDKSRGILREASTVRADLFRENEDKTLTLIPIDLESVLKGDKRADVALRPNDRLVVYRLTDVAFLGTRKVEVMGAVNRPGIFTRADGMRVVDLIRLAGGLDVTASRTAVFLQRYDPDGHPAEMVRINIDQAAGGDESHNVVLRDRDVLTIYSNNQAAFRPQAAVEILGAIHKPGTYTRARNMNLADLLAIAGGLLPNASDMIEITSSYAPKEATPVLIPAKDAFRHSIELKDGDVVTIPSISNYRIRPATVTVLGAVERPGPYTINESSKKLTDIIKRSGGLVQNAFPVGVQFLRKPELLKTMSQQALTGRLLAVLEIVNESEYRRAVAQADFEKLKALRTASDSSPSIAIPGLGQTGGDASLPINSDLVRAVLDRQTVSPARPLTNEDLIPAGNMNVNLPKAMTQPGKEDDIELMDGDIIIVPEKPTTVSVVGAVMIPSSVVFAPGKNIQHYLDRSGGWTLDASKEGMLLIKPNGSVIKAKTSTKVELGDVIFVPTKVMAVQIARNQSTLDQATKALSSGALIYAILRSILR